MANLRSKAIATVLDLVAEGEIVGLVDGAKSIYLDGVQLQNPNGTYNFEGTSYRQAVGTNTQEALTKPTMFSVTGNSAFRATEGVQSEQSVNVKVTTTSPIVRTISNADVNQVRVTVSTPALYSQNNKGELEGGSIQYAIDVQSNGGGYVQYISDTISGKTTSKYQRDWEFVLSGSAPWDIRVRRVTADNTNDKVQNDLYWDTYTEIIMVKLRYPNSALIQMTIDSAKFSGVPSRAYDMKLKKVQIPSNYDPINRTYSGAWNGTFYTAWTDNPAWCFYDLVTNTRYGLGGYIDAAQVDKWGLYTIAQYCDQLVPNGFGGYEPRFTCNMYLQSRAEAYKVLQDMASTFRAMLYWASGSLTLSQDAPSDPVALFTQSNVIDGVFSYSGGSAKARHTVVLVTWNDPDDLYKQKVEYVEDEEAIARFGVVQTEVVAVGCTSRGQANRVGRWLLYSERNESEAVTFQTGIEGAVARPGQIIKVADANRAGARLGGRVSTATTTSITLDSPVDLGAASWTLYVMLPNGTVETRTVTGAVGATISVSPALSAAPQAGSQWIMSASTVEAQTFRVMSVTEQDGGIFEITALKHDPLKYAVVENGLVLQPRDITLLNDPPATPTGGSVTEYLYTTLTDVRIGVNITWLQAFRAASYIVTYSVNNGNDVEVTTTEAAIELTDAQPGTYRISIVAATSLGVKSQALTLVSSVLGKTARPADITGLRITAQADTGILQWDELTDIDVKIGGKVAVRFSEDIVGAQWNTSMPVAEFPGSATTGSVPLRTGSYLVKAVDSSGVSSQNATLIVSDSANILQFNAVASSTQHPTFPGAKTNTALVGDKLQLEQTVQFDDIADLDAFTASLDSGIVESGEYEFDTYIDTGAVYTSRVSASFGVVTFNVSNLADDWPLIDSLGLIDEGFLTVDYIDNWVDLDAIINFDTPTPVDDSTLQIFISTTNDDPAGSPEWSSWRLFYVGDYTARAFKFKVKLIRGADTDQQVALSTLGVTVDVPDRIESANNIAVPTTGLTVTFANAFFATPAIAVTAENLATGDYAQITAKSPTGFTIQFKNAAGTGVERSMDWIAKGFGYRN
jgi:predicted phage tail protein